MMPDELLGWTASILVFAAFCARDMLPLRLLAIASNFAFIAYGYGDRLWPIVILHAAMLPMNVVRLGQLIVGRRKAPGAQPGELWTGRISRHQVARIPRIAAGEGVGDL